MQIPISTLLLFTLACPAWGDPPAEPSDEPSSSQPLSGSEASPSAEGTDPTLIDIQPAQPPSPSERQRMTEWHRRWTRRTREVRQAWKKLLDRLDGAWPLRPDPQCSALGRSLAALDRKTLFPAPDGTVNLYLRLGLRELDRAARACRRDRFFEMISRLEAAAAAFDQAERALADYELTP